MRVVVIGGGGFIGSALVKHLSARHECVCFGHAGRFAELREKLNAEVECVEGDVTDADAVREVLRGADAVVYAAGTGGEADCLSDPTRSLLAHVYGAQLLAREALKANVRRFVFTSTIAVYGTYKPRAMPLTEEMEARPDEFYGALKATAERALIASGRFRLLRLSHVYGSGSGLFSLSSGGAGKVVQQMPIHMQDAPSVAEIGDDVAVPDLVELCATHTPVTLFVVPSASRPRSSR